MPINLDPTLKNIQPTLFDGKVLTFSDLFNRRVFSVMNIIVTAYVERSLRFGL